MKSMEGLVKQVLHPRDLEGNTNVTTEVEAGIVSDR